LGLFQILTGKIQTNSIQAFPFTATGFLSLVGKIQTWSFRIAAIARDWF